jgi:hypothetical protein
MRMRPRNHNSGDVREACSSLRSRCAATLVLILLLNMVSAVRADERTEFFETRIRPQLVKHCYECHSSASSKAEGGLKLDSRDAVLAGGESGKGLVSGKPEESLLIEAIRYESLEMPPSGKLSDDVIADFEKWIRDGAVDPRERPASADDSPASSWQAELAERSKWWSLQRPKDVVPPACDDATWSAEPVDRFIHAALSDAGLSPAKPATASVLLRRLAFVLTGLPPTPGQVETFPAKYADNPQRALEELVDELLASPHFGERFARHWMDVVRYTDTYGYEWDIPARGSWEYRDYLVRAFNSDVAFDQLIREQVAGDLLSSPRINDDEGLNESMIGPMFYHMGEHRHGSSLAFNGIHQEMIDNKIDAFSKTFLAMTVACARCHDHKLDAISQADYYALAGVFMTPRWTARPIDSRDKYSQQIEEVKKLRAAIHAELGKVWMTNRGPLASGTALRAWAIENRAAIQDAKPEDIAWPLRRLLNDTQWLKSSELSVAASAEATELVVSPEGSVLAGGPIPDRDSYTVTFKTEPGQAAVIRLEALTHDSLGSKGPGRTAHGNFVLSGISATVKPLAESGAASRDVTFSSASADYSQPNYPVAAALKPASGTGWGVGLGGNVDRTAQFYLSEPIDLPHGGEWTIKLDFNLGTQHVLGRFRLSIGGDSAAADSSESDGLRDKQATETWTQLADEWRRTHVTRQKANERFEPLTDFSTPGLPDGWVADGAGMEHGYVTPGTPLVSLSGDQLVAEFLDAGYHTRALSPKLPGALRSPAPQTFSKQRVTLKLAGGEWAGRRDIPENAFLNEGPQFFDPKAAPTWMAVAAPGLTNGVTRVLTEITTASLNSNFPPRTGVANSGGVRLPDKDEGFDKLSWFSVTGIVSNDGGGGPADELNEFVGLYSHDNPVTEDACWDQLRGWLASPIDRWAAGQATPSDVKLLNWLLSSKLLPGDAASLPDVSRLVDRYREVEASIGFPRSANSMDERGVQPVDYRLNIRGDVYREADPVPRGFLQVFSDGQRVGYDEGSGRLELAEYLSSRDNPQTARVFVNRVWHWVFGTGLVATPNDFGKLGDRPSHPELLDWLANQFMKEGWSTKKLVRRLVLSQAFRQSGTVSEKAADRDPANRLLHHYPTRRLEAEAIRDSLLAVSGSLDRQLYGRPINPPRTAEDSMKRLFSGPLDSNRRRSLYIEMSIMEPPAFLVGFNLPDLKLPTGRRDETNVPAQALAMLNDPLVIQQAELWGEQLVNDESKTVAQRVRRMFIQALGRTPDEHELKLWTNAVTSFSASGDTMSDRQAWTELAHTMFNTKEFIYYR